MSDTAERDYRRRARFGRFAFRLVRSAGRKRQSWIDRLLTRLLRRATTPKPGADFMRDDLVDADIGFDPAELARYQQSRQRPLEYTIPPRCSEPESGR